MRFSTKVFLSSLLIDLAGVLLYILIIKVIYGPFASLFTTALISLGMFLLVLLPCSVVAALRSRPVQAALDEYRLSRTVDSDSLKAVDSLHYRLSWFAIGWQNLACFLAFAVGYSIFEGDPLVILKMRFWREYMGVLSVFLLMSIGQALAFNLLMSKVRIELGIKELVPGKRFGLGARIIVTGMSLVLIVTANLMSVSQIGVSEIYIEQGLGMARLSYRDLAGDEAKRRAALAMVEGMDAFLARTKAYNDSVRSVLESGGPGSLPPGYLAGFIESVHWKNPLMAAIEGKSDGLVRRIFLYSLISFPVSFLILFLLVYQLLWPFKAVKQGLSGLKSGKGGKRDRLPITSIDEVGEVMDSFNRIIDRHNHELFELSRIAIDIEGTESSIGQTLRLVDQAAQVITEKAKVAYEASSRQKDEVGGAERDVADLAESVAAAARAVSGQNEAIRSLSASIADIQQGIDGVRDSTARTEALSEELVRASAAGEKSLRDCFGMMSGLKESSGKAAELVRAVGDIADRTNLLAMNASIEAAHAGSAGRGFQVVAGEIRGLANDSHAQADAILQVMSAMLVDIERVVRLSADAEASFGSVKRGVSGTNALTKDIAATMNEQALATAAIRASADELVGRAKDMEALASTQESKARALEGFARVVVNSSAEIFSASEAQMGADEDIGKTIARLKEAEEKNRSAVSSLRALT
jgi:methyl-accepting chemotaxis protein